MVWAVSSASADLMRIAVSAPFSGADHDGGRRRKAKRTGAGDNQHRNGGGKGEFKGLAHKQPDDGAQQRKANNGWNKDAADLIGELGNRRFGGTCILHQPDDLRQSRVVSHAGGLKAEIAGFVDGRGHDLVAGIFFHRDGFAGQRRFIHRRTALDEHAVHRDGGARFDRNKIADLHLFDRNFHLSPVTDDQSRLGRQVDELGNGLRGFALERVSKYFPTVIRVKIIPEDSKYRSMLYWATSVSMP